VSAVDPMPDDVSRVTLFLCGDVMTGRGVDQILPHPGGSHIFEPYVQDAREYVALAEARSGPIGKPVTPEYIWGEALSELERVAPDVRAINLETSVTTSDDVWQDKGINYRMHPENVACLTAARIDVCGLANNHVMDYGYAGLAETLDTLSRVGLNAVGAGRTLAAAEAPAIVALQNGPRAMIAAFGAETSGIPPEWAAAAARAGVNLLPDLSQATAQRIAMRLRQLRRPRDVVVAAIHWGGNWGYDVPRAHVHFAHWLIDGGVDVVYGHSSHHPRPIEVYRDRLILYGCGDFIDDYEGIEGHEAYRDDLVLMYFPTLAATTGELTSLLMTPLQIRKMTLTRPSHGDAEWLRDTLDRVSAPYRTHIDLTAEGRLSLRWNR
jgi:poly-gamma-glutamate capsule biosynthesis protein CapA/YwtB (metallophosphatase superfamily)